MLRIFTHLLTLFLKMLRNPRKKRKPSDCQMCPSKSTATPTKQTALRSKCPAAAAAALKSSVHLNKVMNWFSGCDRVPAVQRLIRLLILFTFLHYLGSIQQIKTANTHCYRGTAGVDVSTGSNPEHNTGQITITKLKNKIHINATY